MLRNGIIRQLTAGKVFVRPLKNRFGPSKWSLRVQNGLQVAALTAKTAKLEYSATDLAKAHWAYRQMAPNLSQLFQVNQIRG